jgi:uncharacterized membrane protein
VTKPSRGEVAARYAKAHDVSLSEAARLHGVSRERVRQKWRDLFGDEPSPLQKARERRDSAIADLASQGLSVTEIAEVVGSAMDTVNRVRNRNGLMIVNGNDKRAVTEETKTRILELARAGKSGAVIAHETGAVVRQGLNGQTDHIVRTSSAEWPSTLASVLSAHALSPPRAHVSVAISWLPHFPAYIART